jgi:hypothetical protein
MSRNFYNDMNMFPPEAKRYLYPIYCMKTFLGYNIWASLEGNKRW